MRGILARLGIGSADTQDTDTVRRIAGQLDELEPDRARYVAAFAFVLSRIARADHEISADEVSTMERLIQERASLPPEQAVLAVQMAKTQQLLFGGTEDFLVTRELLRITTYEQRLAILDCLFAVAASDQQIRTAEADEIGRIARELRVEQTDLSALRSRYRDALSVRRGFGEAPPATST
jgi:uncharacterized tellurite resistance protein B-like protein